MMSTNALRLFYFRFHFSRYNLKQKITQCYILDVVIAAFYGEWRISQVSTVHFETDLTWCGFYENNMSFELSDGCKYKYNLLKNVNRLVTQPCPEGKSYLTRGDFDYFHYCCDDVNDVGWGCGYRTCQSLCSWIVSQQQRKITVPTLLDIQKNLVDIGDRPQSFVGSREWIGALEVFYIIDTLFDVSCKIQHIPKGEMKRYVSVLRLYFEQFGGLVMMGGDIDASSKGVAGIHIADNDAYLLVILKDPHFVGMASSDQLIAEGFVKWRHTSEFDDSSFYNLCLPQLTSQ